MGAISSDKIGFRFSEYDEGSYRIALAKKRQEQKDG